MRRIDAASGIDERVLVERAGTAVAWAARAMLGGVYGRRVVVLAGPGNNGADGRIAGRILQRWGVAVTVVDIDHHTPPPNEIDEVDLVIDAAFGTGFAGVFVAPSIRAHTKVLVVDVPSGVDGLTGFVDPASRVLRADRTVTFAGYKAGLLLGEGAELAGPVTVADIGLDVHHPERITTEFVGDGDWPTRLPRRGRDAHKWKGAVLVVAGSPGMTGAAHLSAQSAARAGAGLVRLAIPGDLASGDEIVGVPIPVEGWSAAALSAAARCQSIVLGPGLGRNEETSREVRAVLRHLAWRDRPVVIDGDGLFAVDASALAERVRGTTVLTPHDGEFARLAGSPPGRDRVASAQELAKQFGAVVLLKGPTTVIASPDGFTSLVRAGDQRLATAGSGDVLAGIIGAFLAQGIAAHDAASTAAAVHGAAALRGRRVGLLAGDLPELVADLLTSAADQTERVSLTSSASDHD
jgi:ADP-dependent NAD(P)H-hydrate dehydratase / NAD(P)H-hydrate epimerase